ncbi:MAG: hypothetical protein DRG78_11350 [Epsilonproteobacteria bacterium]|nr:MAG: hypothetical protein DRG78_11350 [Campylobacterota bacterium]
MYFELHNKAVIGYKKLKEPDLGIKKSSHQTHIGLLTNAFSFTNKKEYEGIGTLIYENKAEQIYTPWRFIQRANGNWESPNLKSGGTTKKSMVKEIRNIVKNSKTKDWYIMWFALKDDSFIVMLIKENSKDFIKLLDICASLEQGTIDRNDNKFYKIVDYFSKKTEVLYDNYSEILEDLALTHNLHKKTISENDIKKAQELCKKIGKQGEELIANYLDKQKSLKNITDYLWLNKSSESYLEYDFKIIDNNNQSFYTDVKSTNHRFGQKIYFSKNELEFINKNQNNYYIQRVYNLNNNPILRESKNINKLINKFTNNYNLFNDKLKEDELQIDRLNIMIKPTNNILEFSNEIIL